MGRRLSLASRRLPPIHAARAGALGCLAPRGANAPSYSADRPNENTRRRPGVFANSRLVGTAGFEPTTLCPPGRCATRLRYAPTRVARIHPGCPAAGAGGKYSGLAPLRQPVRSQACGTQPCSTPNPIERGRRIGVRRVSARSTSAAKRASTQALHRARRDGHAHRHGMGVGSRLQPAPRCPAGSASQTADRPHQRPVEFNVEAAAGLLRVPCAPA
jgi:hypothetical protein